MAKQASASNQTTLIAIFALVAALVIGTVFFLTDIDSFLRDLGR